jgi:hypothetical protein
VVEPVEDDVALELALLPARVAEVPEERGAVVIRVLALHLEAVAEQRVASGGVDHEARLPLAHGAVGVHRGHAGGLARAAEVDLAHAAVLARLGDHARGAAEEDLVEFGAAHLVGDRHRAVGGVAEQEARAVGVRGRDEGRARLHHPDLGHLARDTQLLEERQVRRQQRLADVEARMGILFPPAPRGGRARRAGSRWSILRDRHP